MASMIMHLCASHMLQQYWQYSDKFLLGSILPDIWKHITGERNESHYMVGKSDKDIDVEAFCRQHHEELQRKNEIYLGYMSHLIQDKIWFNDYCDTDTMSEQEYYDKVYSFYPLADRYLLSYHSLNIQEILKRLLKQTTHQEIQEKIQQEVWVRDKITDEIKLNVTMEQLLEWEQKSVNEYDKRLGEIGWEVL